MQLFETKRLVGRRLSLKDLPELTAILSDPEVMRYSVRGICDENATRNFIEWCIKCYEIQGVGPWALIEKSTDELVGFCGVSPEMVDDAEELNLGYRLARKFWNYGLATEAVNGVLDYAFANNLVNSVVVIIEPEHIASLRVAEKVGFSEYNTLEFHNRPVRLYRMTREARVNGAGIGNLAPVYS